MHATALKIAGFVALLTSVGPVWATDTTEPDAIAVWEADKSTIFDAADVEIDAFKWRARPVIVFADSAIDPAFTRQLDLLNDRLEELTERDVVLIVDTAPDDRSALRTKLRPRGFMLTLIGKDGGVKLRKPFPWDVRELTRQIDKMPIRRQEIVDAKADAASEADE
jgi:hypothetical protein